MLTWIETRVRYVHSLSICPMAQAPRFLQDLVGQVFREHRRTEHVTLVTLQQHWAALVGPGVAERTWPSRLQQGVLWITAPDSSWAYQLQFLKNELLNGIRAGLPAFQLTDLRFKVGDLPASEAVSTVRFEAPVEKKPRTMPTLSQVAEPHVAESPAAAQPAEPVAALPHAPAEPPPVTPELARAAESITDPTLRAAFLRALGKQARREEASRDPDVIRSTK